MNNKRLGAIVTGAAGFIGSHIVDLLLAQGKRVVGIDNFTLGRRENLKKSLQSPQFTLVEADLSKPIDALVPKVSEALADLDMIECWHMAANSDIAKGAADAAIDLRDTFMTTYFTLALCRQLNAAAFYFASSSAVYGDRDEVLREDSGPLLPISNYGAMKLASEGLISAAYERFLQRAIIFRFPNVVGARGTHGAAYDFIRRLNENSAELTVLGDGQQAKPYLHVSELVSAMISVAEKTTSEIDCLNIGVKDGVTAVRFIAEEVVRQFAPDARIIYGTAKKGWVGDVPRVRLSTDRIAAHGWKSKLSSDEAIVRAVAELIQDLRSAE